MTLQHALPNRPWWVGVQSRPASGEAPGRDCDDHTVRAATDALRAGDLFGALRIIEAAS